MAINRRTFLIRGSGVVAAAGAATALPAFLPILAGAGAAEPTTGSAPSTATPESSLEMTGGPMTEPLVAHIRDLSTGEIGLFSGEKEIVIHDRSLARSLFRATR